MATQPMLFASSEFVDTGEVGFARRVARRIVFMDGDKIMKVGTPERFFTSAPPDRTKVSLSQII